MARRSAWGTCSRETKETANEGSSRLEHPESWKGVSRMKRMPLQPGDKIDVQVTKVLPFGVLVETDTGLAGLVRGANSAVGTSIRVEVVQYDNSDSRFSASMA